MGFFQDIGYLADLRAMSNAKPGGAVSLLSVVVEDGPIPTGEVAAAITDEFDEPLFTEKEVDRMLNVAASRGFARYDRKGWHSTAAGHRFNTWVWDYIARKGGS